MVIGVREREREAYNHLLSYVALLAMLPAAIFSGKYSYYIHIYVGTKEGFFSTLSKWFIN